MQLAEQAEAYIQHQARSREQRGRRSLSRTAYDAEASRQSWRKQFQ